MPTVQSAKEVYVNAATNVNIYKKTAGTFQSAYDHGTQRITQSFRIPNNTPAGIQASNQITQSGTLSQSINFSQHVTSASPSPTTTQQTIKLYQDGQPERPPLSLY